MPPLPCFSPDRRSRRPLLVHNSSADVSNRGTTHVVGQPGEWIGITNYDTAGFAGRHGLFSYGSGLDPVVRAQTGA